MHASFENTESTQRIGGDPADTEADLRRRAVGNLHARRGFVIQLAVYVLVNAALLWSWASGGFGFPWPLFVLIFWGIGLVWQGWSLYGPGESEARIRREMDRLRGTR